MPKNRQHWKNPSHIAYLLILSNALSGLSTDIHLPAMPKIVQELGTTDYMVQLILPLAFFASLLTRLLWGPMSDAWGRRAMLMPILLTNLVGNLVSVVATNIEWLLAGRFIAGLAFGSANIVAMTIISDLFQGKERTRMLTVLDTIMPVFMVTAPILGAYILQWFGWRGNFGFILIAQLLVNLLAWMVIPETITDQEDELNLKKAFKGYQKLAIDPVLMGYCLIPAIASGNYSFMLVQAPFIYIDQFKLTPQMCGYLMALPLLGQFFAGAVHQALLRYIGPERTLRIGIIATFLVVVNAGILIGDCYPWGISALFSIATLQSIAWSFLLAPSITLAFDMYPKYKGVVSSLVSITRGIMWTLFSHLGAVFYNKTAEPFLWGTALGAAGVIILWFLTVAIVKKYAERTIK